MPEDEIQFDIRTRHPIMPKTKEAPKNQKDILEEQRKRALFKDLVSHPGWKPFREQSYALVKPQIPHDVDSAVVFHFASMARTTVDMIFNYIEGQAAVAKAPEEMPIVDGARASYFKDNPSLALDINDL